MEPTPDLDLINQWIAVARQRGGTDLLLTAGANPLARIDGAYRSLAEDSVLNSVLTAEDTRAIAAGLLTPAWRAVLDERQQVDFSFSWNGQLRVRGNAYVQRGCIAFALRLIPLRVPTADELGLPISLAHLSALPSGLVLMTGPTGSGKSTTLAALLDHVNMTRCCHILTVEEPIEYVHEHKRSVVSQREIGVDATSFADALRAALREDPDVILVGEMRDLESIAIALTLAETGHLVFATLHTNDTAQSLDRIIDVFPSDRREQIQAQLSSTLQGVIYQRLVPRIAGGMVGAFEIMTATNAVRNLLREGKTRQLRNIVSTGQADGMQTLESCLSGLVADGVITEENAIAASLHPTEITKPRLVTNGAERAAGTQPGRG